MEIQEFVKKTELVPLAELTTLAAHRGAFGDDVLAAFTDASAAAADGRRKPCSTRRARRTATRCSPREQRSL